MLRELGIFFGQVSLRRFRLLRRGRFGFRLLRRQRFFLGRFLGIVLRRCRLFRRHFAFRFRGLGFLLRRLLGISFRRGGLFLHRQQGDRVRLRRSIICRSFRRFSRFRPRFFGGKRRDKNALLRSAAVGLLLADRLGWDIRFRLAG